MRELESVHEFESTVVGKFEWRWRIETGWAQLGYPWWPVRKDNKPKSW